ncbi:glycosyltransferase family 39 protein [Mycobacterium sp. CBMA293]|uniref:ArnT family glycosyltransferase n=1 Tax=unclassified Mycolicibacterium TaxID=2636767 RepID=UPI0012DE4013|nr:MULTISPECIES: glycosyltransferase family 39 protein [unclassified Mycolicibacterium]MUL46036.1 glycosyltransferase family 39 protein [Mycolicibacterium sp. CBMA 360]MUL60708.1 glycosyltransferase family 39 protein [Mycolicibacterium sp. CBMA 335]MUL72523.1 glycosyltransferase family 39 protein [Mycolicibacterium sp. CBMA 311]MUL95076.1 glycosyltransferase family 39 protein [Mycolicibacterium sp. CBMA 230]MUM07106.1 glycosyl transferase [Mycolicibacterium sp. CBMA 213]
MAPADADSPAEPGPAPKTRRPVGEWLRVGLLLAGTAVLYLWNLSVSGWANSFYSAAAQAGSTNWTAMLFGASDSGNAITVDKIPGALWVTDLSVRLFGLSSWSILVPQALMGVTAVGVLYAAVRRAAGPGAALVAGTVFALTPVATLIFRFNNPDALLVLLLVVAAYCLQRACEKDAHRRWLVLVGVAVGFAFLAKMMQAFLVLPAFATTYLVAGPAASLRTRLAGVLGSTLAMVVSGGWYLLLVELWPTSSRPYIGGSQDNSIIELALGYNGVGRLSGDEPGGLGNPNFDVGWDRLVGASMGSYAGWLLPAALLCLAAGLLLTRRAPRTDPTRAALIMWGGWLLFTGAIFSYANGIVHPYYTVALAPAIGACVGIGSMLLWRNRTALLARITMAAAASVTVALAAMLLGRGGGNLGWLRIAVLIVGAVAVLLLVAPPRFSPVRLVVAATVLACLAGPTAYSIATAAVSHTGAMPSVGPPGAHGGWGPPGGHGPRPGGHGPRPGGPGMGWGRKPGGGLLDSPAPSAGLTTLLTGDAAQYRWAAAVIGSNNAAGYQLAARVPVMAVGGFNGTDPSPTLAQFQQYVAAGQIHYFIDGDVRMGWGPQGQDSGSQESQQIATWISAYFAPTTVDGTVVYDLSHPAARNT